MHHNHRATKLGCDDVMQVTSLPFWTSVQRCRATGGGRLCCCLLPCMPTWASWLPSVSPTLSQSASGDFFLPYGAVLLAAIVLLCLSFDSCLSGTQRADTVSSMLSRDPVGKVCFTCFCFVVFVLVLVLCSVLFCLCFAFVLPRSCWKTLCYICKNV